MKLTINSTLPLILLEVLPFLVLNVLKPAKHMIAQIVPGVISTSISLKPIFMLGFLGFNARSMGLRQLLIPGLVQVQAFHPALSSSSPSPDEGYYRQRSFQSTWRKRHSFMVSLVIV